MVLMVSAMSDIFIRSETQNSKRNMQPVLSADWLKTMKVLFVGDNRRSYC